MHGVQALACLSPASAAWQNKKMIAAIQAGGRSSRMGEDKSWLIIDGRPMIEHVLAAAQPVVNKLKIVINHANPNRARYENLAAHWQAELLYDSHDFRGPLGGIETVLQQCSAGEDALILACDLPFVTTEFLRFLCAIHATEKSTLTVSLDQANRPQMLAAIYSSVCLEPISKLLAANDLKARLLCEQVVTRFVSFAEYEDLPNAACLLMNVNRQEDLHNMRA